MGLVYSGGRAVRVQNSEYAHFRETVTDISRQIEDLTWISLSTDNRNQGLDDLYDERRRLIQRIRLFRRRSPLAKQAAVLLQHYVLGRGVSLRSANKAKVGRLVDEFWELPANKRTFTGFQAMAQMLDTTFTDGNFLLVLYPDDQLGTLELGYLDYWFLDDVVLDPDNSKVPLWYKVRQAQTAFSWADGTYLPALSNEFVYYRDWRNDRDDYAPPASMRAQGLVYHVTINQRGKFGESDIAAALDWLKSHREFMEDRASLTRSAAQFSWKKKRKGGAADVAQAVSTIQSSLTQNINSWESNPPPVAGSTIVENEGTSMDWIKTDTGGANATSDERILRMMAGAGMGGIPNHYFGDEANANLATATSMELPLLKTYENWQKLLEDVIKDLLEFMLNTANVAGRVGDRDDSTRYADRVTTPQAVISKPEAANDPDSADTVGTAINEAMGSSTGPEAPVVQIEMIPKNEPPSVVATADDKSGKVDWFIEVQFPPIVQKDLNIYMAAIKAFFELMPASNIESQKLAVELSLNALGISDVDETMQRIFPPELLSPKVVNAVTDMADKLGPGAQPSIGGRPLPPEPPPPPPVFKGLKESEVDPIDFREERMRRIIRVASGARDALARVGG